MTQPPEAVEELLELLWTAGEDGLTPVHQDHLPRALRCFVPSPPLDQGSGVAQTVEAALAAGLIHAAQGRLELSAAGRAHAEQLVRRHRLAESLLAGALQISDADLELTACQMEHILNADVTNAVCAFLGHPPVCPHDRAIPRGLCCLSADRTVAPLVVPLEQAAVGEPATLAFIHTARHQYRRRLSLMGLIPGARLVVRQRRPALVIAVGETELALDQQAGRELFVRRVSCPAAAVV